MLYRVREFCLLSWCCPYFCLFKKVFFSKFPFLGKVGLHEWVAQMTFKFPILSWLWIIPLVPNARYVLSCYNAISEVKHTSTNKRNSVCLVNFRSTKVYLQTERYRICLKDIKIGWNVLTVSIFFNPCYFQCHWQVPMNCQDIVSFSMGHSFKT